MRPGTATGATPPAARSSAKIGAERTEGSKDGLTRRQAEAKLRRLINETPATAAVTERVTVAALGCRYVRHRATIGRKRSTIAAVEGHIKHRHEPFFGDKALDAIKPEDVDDLVALMLAGQRPSGITRSKPLSPKTIVNAVGTLTAMVSYAIRKKWATSNPVLEVDLPSTESSENIRWIRARRGRGGRRGGDRRPLPACRPGALHTGAMTWLRECELIALRLRDVDWVAGRIRVRQNHVLGEYGTPKSRRSTHSVPMADRVGAELEWLI